MSFLAWLALGLISGFIASFLVRNNNQGLLGDIVLGVIGAFAGGYLFHFFNKTGITGFNPWSVFVAVCGSVAVLVVFHTLRRMSR